MTVNNSTIGDFGPCIGFDATAVSFLLILK